MVRPNPLKPDLILSSRSNEPEAIQSESAPREESPAIASLLRDLGAHLQRGSSAITTLEPNALQRCPSGIPDLDRLISGGIPVGRLSEITGAPSSGRTSVAMGLLVEATRAGHSVAWIDAPQAFDAESAAAAGVRLERVLWVRPPSPRDSIRCCERLLKTHGFALTGLDFSHEQGRSLPPATWQRLARAVAHSQTALLVLSSTRLSGSFADLALELKKAKTTFSGTPALLEALEIGVTVVRHRSGPTHHATAIRLRPPRLD